MGLETENPKLFLEEAKEALKNFQEIQENRKASIEREKEASQGIFYKQGFSYFFYTAFFRKNKMSQALPAPLIKNKKTK